MARVQGRREVLEETVVVVIAGHLGIETLARERIIEEIQRLLLHGLIGVVQELLHLHVDALHREDLVPVTLSRVWRLLLPNNVLQELSRPLLSCGPLLDQIGQNYRSTRNLEALPELLDTRGLARDPLDRVGACVSNRLGQSLSAQPTVEDLVGEEALNGDRTSWIGRAAHHGDQCCAPIRAEAEIAFIQSQHEVSVKLIEA